MLDREFVLPADVVQLAARELHPDLLEACEAGRDDVLLTRPGYRNPTVVISGEVAALISEFRTPSLIEAAVVRYARARNQQPLPVLEAAFPAVVRLIQSRILAPLGTYAVRSAAPSLKRGARVGSATVLRPLAIREDSEVYEVSHDRGARATLKIAWRSRSAHACSLIENEAAVLLNSRLPQQAPLLDLVETADAVAVILEWRSGVHASEAALRLRRIYGPCSRPLVELAANICGAFAALHSVGFVHGDVHPGNVLVESPASVSLIDYGHSSAPGVWPRCGNLRGGVVPFLDPQAAAALLACTSPEPANLRSEQFEVAALVDHLITGTYYVSFSLLYEPTLRLIADAPAQTFRDRGLPSLPGVEAALAVALRKAPGERHDSLDDLKERLLACIAPRRGKTARERATIVGLGLPEAGGAVAG